jgi:oligopeptide transport system substrate-binding protein
LSVVHSTSESNSPGYDNPAYDALLARIRGTGDRRARNVLMCAAEKVLSWDVPMVPFYFYTRSYLLRDFVRGFEPHYLDRHLLKYMSIQP